VGAALTLGLRGGGVLVSTLVLPLYTPILIFGAGAVTAAAGGLDPEAYLSLLGAFLIVALAFVPWATAAALRISLD
jgi:heme exporter protein B